MRLDSLGDKLIQVLSQFAAHGGERGVFSATAWPMNWREAAAFQEVYGLGEHGSQIDYAVSQALELLHPDYAYEFQIGWTLWDPETENDIESQWVRRTRLVRVLGYGPEFDDGAYEQEGHIRIDFGSDAPFLQEGVTLNAEAIRCLEENIRQLIDLIDAVEKESEATARLLWSELGDTLAAKLLARLNRLQ